MYTINVGVRQENGDFQEVRIDNGGRLNLSHGDRLVLAAAPEDVEIVSGDRGDYVVRLKGGEEFSVASADDAKELVLISPDTGEPLIMFDIQHPEQEVDAHVSQPLGVHQASVAGTEFLQQDVGEDLGMGQFLDMASFSAEGGGALISASGPSFPDWEEPAGTLPWDDGTGDSNNAPSVSGSVDLGSIDEEGSLAFSRSDLLATASDADGDALTVTGLSVASGDGTLTDNGDGTWTFAPSADWNGAVIFNYTVCDGNGGTIDTSANLTVNPVNDTPVIDVNVTINVEAEATVSLAGYLHAGDVDNKASELASTITRAPEFGTLMLDGVAITDFSGMVFTQADIDAGRITYRFAPEAGSEIRVVEDNSFNFTVTDGLAVTPEMTFDMHSIPVQVWGTNGEDLISGTTATTRADATFLVYGFDGDDWVYSGVGDDTLYGGDGNDTLDGGAGNDSLAGGDGDDNLDGGTGNDTLAGGDGDDKLNGGAGADTLDGGSNTSGGDWADYSTSSAPVYVDLNNSGAQSGGYAEGDVLTGIENVVGTAHADTLIGEDYTNNVFASLVGADLLVGGESILTVTDDTSGIPVTTTHYFPDTADYSLSPYWVNVDLNNTGGQTGGWIGNHAEGDTLVGIENVIGTYNGDSITGDGNNNFLDGQDGTDTIMGGAGADTLLGGAGDDTLGGGEGADFIDGGDGFDMADYSQSDTWVRILLDFEDAQMGGGTGNHGLGDVLTGIENVVGSNDTLHGDVLMGDDADNVLFGLAGNDTLDGDAGNDSLAGGDGDDTLDGGTGADTLDGGSNTSGGDWADYSTSSAPVYVDLNNSGAQSGGYAEGDVLTGIENVVGTAHADTLIGEDYTNNVFASLVGADLLVGGESILTVTDDTSGIPVTTTHYFPDTADYSLSPYWVNVDLNNTGGQTGGWIGNHAEGDTLVGIENVIGTYNGDSITGDGNNNFLDGQDGTDTIMGGAGADTLLGGAGDDTLGGGEGADFIDGGDGFDMADYSQSDTWVRILLDFEDAQMGGGTGNHGLGDVLTGIENVVGSNDTLHGDVLMGDDADNVLFGLAGNDTLDGDAGNDSLAGGDGDDNLGGGTGNDTLAGGDGDDKLNGGVGADTLDGGSNTSGGDWADYSTSSAPIYVDLNNSGAQSGGYAEGDVLTGIENVVGTAHADTLIGEDYTNNVFASLVGADLLVGGESILTVTDDTSGIPVTTTHYFPDTADYSLSPYWVNVDLNNTGGQTGGWIGNHAEGDTLVGIENVIGTYNGDSITGDGNNNFLDGQDGTDTIMGGAGADTLLGGAGDDTLGGGEGADFIDGGDGFDMADYSQSDTWVRILLDFEDAQMGGGTGNHGLGDVLTGIENVVGSNDTLHGDVLMGDDADNVLFGLAGNDTLDGGAGADTLDGGSNTVGEAIKYHYYGDTFSPVIRYEATPGGDWADYGASDAAVHVDLTSSGAQSGGHAEGDVLTGIENVLGSAHGDTLIGQDYVSNVFAGLAGADSLVGGESILDVIIDPAWGFRTNYYYPDTADYSLSSSWVNVDLNTAGGQTGGGSGNHALGDTLAGIENVIGTNDAHGDALTGDGSHNFLDGLAGADTLMGGAGDDTLRGGSGADFLDGGTNTQWERYINYGDWVDYSTSTAGVSVNLYHQDGTATQSGGDAGGDTLLGIENVMGSEHDDSLVGDDAGNWLAGLDGNDTMVGDTAVVSGDYSHDSMWGGAGEDLMYGGAGNDQMWGDSGDDRLTGGLGKDSLYGGDGDDILHGSVSLNNYNNNFNDDAIIGVDNTAPLFTVAYDDSGDFLSGGAGRDILDGGGGLFGRETLEGGADGDMLLGFGTGGGNNLAYYENSPIRIYLDLDKQDGSGQIDPDGLVSEATGDTLLGIQHVQATRFDDTVLGSSEDNEIFGGEGSDFITGGEGQDSLWGDWKGDYHNWGNDTLEGGAGADYLNGSEGGMDIASYRNSAQGVRVDLDDQNYALPGPPNPLNPGQGEPGQIGASPTGEEHGDWLWNIDGVWGSEHGDTLLGRNDGWTPMPQAFIDHPEFMMPGYPDYDDQLWGFGGDDSLNGGDGDDSLYGGDGNDTLIGWKYDLTDTNMNRDSGIDLLDGGAGDDSLIGGPEDIVHGGEGFDVFALEAEDLSFSHTLDLSAMVSEGRISGIEKISLYGVNGWEENVMTLQASDVLAVSDTDTLWVFGEGPAEVSTTDSGWSLIASDVVGSDGFEYNHYTNTVGPSVVHLMVAEDIASQNIMG